MNNSKTYRVFELNQIIKNIIEQSCPYPLWVQGEISDFDKNKHRSNIYFQLSEKDIRKNEILSSVKCVLYEFQKDSIRDRLKKAGIKISQMDGLSVRLQIKISVSARYGNYLLTVQDIDPMFTLGQIAQNREEVINWLKQKNLLNENKKRILEKVPLNIGLITSPGEGYQDFINKLKESDFAFKIYFYQASVQGPKTEREISAGIKYFQTMAEQVDALVIIRGGGSATDLSWFDSQLLSEAIASFSKPVLTGIGHFTNISVVDLVAYQNLSTPTAVAEYLIDKVDDFILDLKNRQKELSRMSRPILEKANTKVSGLRSVAVNVAQNISRDNNNNILKFNKIFPELIQKFLYKQKRYQDNLKKQIDTFRPENIMKRGFTITHYRGQSIKNSDKLKKGDCLTTIFYKGEIDSIINKVK